MSKNLIEKSIGSFQHELLTSFLCPFNIVYMSFYVTFKPMKNFSHCIDFMQHCSVLSSYIINPCVCLILNCYSIALCFCFRFLRQSTAYFSVFCLIILWAVPITFIASLTNLQTLSKQLKFLDKCKSNHISISSHQICKNS